MRRCRLSVPRQIEERKREVRQRRIGESSLSALAGFLRRLHARVYTLHVVVLSRSFYAKLQTLTIPSSPPVARYLSMNLSLLTGP